MANYVVKDPEYTPKTAVSRAEVESDHALSVFEAGMVIDSIYRVVRCLRLGRMGVVYLCELIEDASPPLPLVVVKMLHRSICEEGDKNPLFVRFYREVDAAFRIAHPNVVSPLQFIHQEGQLGYSMEFVGGGDLARLLASEGRFSEEQTMVTLEYLVRGVEAIHRAGVIHRDLKLENVLLTEDRCPKIADFGVAYCGYGQRLTSKGSIVGTLQYVSPEYLEKGIVTRQGDIYSLGAIGYELITGQPPFWGLGACELIEAKISRPPADPREVNGDISAGFTHILMKALNRDMGGRFRSASEFGVALREVLERRAIPVGQRDLITSPNNAHQRYAGTDEREVAGSPSGSSFQRNAHTFVEEEIEAQPETVRFYWVRLLMVVIGTLLAFTILWLWSGGDTRSRRDDRPVVVHSGRFSAARC